MVNNETDSTTQSRKLTLKDTFIALIRSFKDIFTAREFWRFYLIFLVFFISVLLLLGFACFVIAFGLLKAGSYISALYPPVRRFFFAVAGTVDEMHLVKKSTLPLWRKIFSSVLVLFWLGTVGFGIWLLLRIGFLQQNLIYLLFFR
jgi:hypothetical protein